MTAPAPGTRVRFTVEGIVDGDGDLCIGDNTWNGDYLNHGKGWDFVTRTALGYGEVEVIDPEQPVPFVPVVVAQHVCDGSDIIDRDRGIGYLVVAIFQSVYEGELQLDQLRTLPVLARMVYDHLDATNVHLADSTRSLQPF